MQCVFKKLINRGKIVKTEKRAYQELTSCLMEATGAVGLIEIAARIGTSPTWVPDYSRLHVLGLINTTSRAALLNATKMSQPPIDRVLNKPKLNGDTITVNGVHLHTIEQIYTLRPTQENYDISEHETHIQNYRIIHLLITAGKGKSQYKPRKEFQKLKLNSEFLAFIDTIWNDETIPKDLSAKDLVDYVQHFKVAEVDAIFSDPTITVDTSFWPPWTKSTTNIFRAHLTLCRLMIRHHCVLFKGINPGVIWQGLQPNCYGICLTNSKKGDKVVLVEGVTVPIIMRPGMDFKLVSPSIVFGMMKGEAWERSESSDDGPTTYYHNRQHQITIS